MFAGGKHLISADATIVEVYGKYKDEDGFLYITYDKYAAYGWFWSGNWFLVYELFITIVGR